MSSRSVVSTKVLHETPWSKGGAYCLILYMSSLYGRTELNRLDGNGTSLWIWGTVSCASHSVLPLGKWGEGIAAVTVIAFVVGGGLSLTSPPLQSLPPNGEHPPLTDVCKVGKHGFFS